MNFSIDYPLWFVGLCVLLGLGYAALLYFKDNTFSEEGKSNKIVWPLSLLRFLTATFISLLLLSPLMRQQFTDVQKPYIIIAQDNSQSIKNKMVEGDSLKFAESIANLSSTLSEDYNVQNFVFGSKTQEGSANDFSAKSTNISGFLSNIYDRFSYQNVGALIIASDGIYNEGMNPLYSNFQLEAPIYTVALGDTTPVKDLKINQVLHNRIAYAGDKTTIRIDVSAINAKGENATLGVYAKGGKKVFSQVLKITEDKFFESVEVILSPRGQGIQSFTVAVSKLGDEENTENNNQLIYIDVLEGKQKITILANSPHPDISAIKQALENGKNYEIEVKQLTDFDGSIAGRDLFIFHGLPGKNRSVSELAGKLKANNIPTWYIVTNQTDVNALNQLQDVVNVSGAGGASTNNAKGAYNANFNLFTYEGTYAQNLQSLPPLSSPFGEYSAGSNAQTMLHQKVGAVETNYPLLAYQQSGKIKTAVLCGEGLWRWRIFDYSKDQQFETVDNLISKTVQYLAVRNDKRQFRVTQPKNLFNENESIVFAAELYNDSYELINEPEANLSVVSETGEEYPYSFSKTVNAYELDAGILPVGSYSFTGRTNYSDKKLKSSGSFTIKPLQLEALRTTANHQLLNSLSQKSGGELVYLNGITQLAEKIKTEETIKPVLYSTYKSSSVINLKWLFFALLALLSLEWFIRKFNGGY